MFASLDFIYLPSRDAAAELRRYTDEFGAYVVFAIEAFGTRVAMIRLAEGEPTFRGESPPALKRNLPLERAHAHR